MTKGLTIISVDDTFMNLILIEEIAKEMGVEVKSFNNPLEALAFIQTNRVDLMFVDYMMPEMDGLRLTKEALLLQEELIPIMVTAVTDDQELKLEALNSGVVDFLIKPVDIAQLEAKIKNFSKIIQLKLQLENFNSRLQEEVDKKTAELVMREYEALHILSRLAEYRDPETGSHIARVSHYSKLLAKEYGLSEREQDILFFSSPLHDIGKIGIQDDILLKPGKLDEEEYEIMKTHSTIGYEILKESKNPYLQAGAIIAMQHHEKYDGSGYFHGLQGEEIHIYGRITAIADVFDALTSERPYKKPWSFDDAYAFIVQESGRHFDPHLVELFQKNRDKIQKIYEKFGE